MASSRSSKSGEERRDEAPTSGGIKEWIKEKAEEIFGSGMAAQAGKKTASAQEKKRQRIEDIMKGKD